MVPVFLEAEGIGALGINLPGLLAQLINFGILLLLFSWVFKRFLFPMLDERKKRIEEGLQASEEAKERLAQTETEVAAEMSRARQEAQGIITQAQQASSRIQEEAREASRTDSEQMIERARQEIQLERDAAISDLRREFADLTITAAERVIRRSLDRKAHGEIETEHPGYLGSQDTFYVGTMKGVGRIYQQTYVDTHCRVAQAKLYQQKTALTAADLLNDRVLPFYEAEGIDVLRILTDRGTEYCGKVDRHEYQLYLALNDIEHTRTKVRSPQTNGICERFHKTILEEFYQVALRKKIYTSLEELQKDLDAWLDEYNHHRPHQGKRCDGKTPYATLIEGKDLAQAKKLVA